MQNTAAPSILSAYLCPTINQKRYPMNSFYDLAKQRRSVRKYQDKEVPKEMVESLLKTVLMSPASKRSNPWEFVVVTDKDKLKDLAGAKKMGGAFIENAPLAIVVMADAEKSDVWVEDTSIASAYLLLAAEDLGLGACWIQIRKRTDNDNTPADFNVKKILGVQKSELVVESIISLGFKDEEKAPFNEEKMLKERVKLNNYNTEWKW